MLLTQETQRVEDDLTLTNQRIVILDDETGHPIDELIGTGMLVATTRKTTLGEERATNGIERQVEGTIELGQGRQSIQATDVVPALRPASGDAALKVRHGHQHHQET